MKTWKVIAKETKKLLIQKSYSLAQIKIQEGLEEFPNQIKLLIIASDLYRTTGDREMSLEFALRLISNHPNNWKGFGRAAEDLIELRRFDQAKIKIREGLEKSPNQIKLLCIANQVFRASGDRKESLVFAESLIRQHPENWNGYARAAIDLKVLRRFDEAEIKIKVGLEKFPKKANLLFMAIDVYHASNNREKSLEIAQRLITFHPENWNSYARAAEDLLALKRFAQAQVHVQEGLEKFPHQIELLCIASDIFRASAESEKSLEIAQNLIKSHPENWHGYGRAVQDLVTLGQFEQAQILLQAALLKFPIQIELLCIASDFLRASAEPEKSLEIAQNLIRSHPENWHGYGRAVQDLVTLKRFEEAKIQLQAGLETSPNQVNLLILATDVYRRSNDHQKSLEYAEQLVTHHPYKWYGYVSSIYHKLALGHWNKTDQILCLANQGIQTLRYSRSTSYGFLCGIRYYHRNPRKLYWANSFVNTKSEIDNEIVSLYQPFQYWSQGTQPADIASITDLWNEHFSKKKIEKIIVFNKEMAKRWISLNTPSLEKAFSTAFHFAVEADIFRIAYASKNNCIWLDSDQYPEANTISFLASKLISCDTLLYFRKDRPWITNAFFATKKNSPFFAKIENDMQGYSFVEKTLDEKQITSSFGPGRFNSTLNDIINSTREGLYPDSVFSRSPTSPVLVSNNWRFGFCNEYEMCKMKPPFPLSYANTNNSWQYYLKAKH